MEWHYEAEGRVAGPVSEIELQGLAAAGVVRADTQVSYDGGRSWQSYDSVQRLLAMPAAIAPGTPTPSAAVDLESCAYCGRALPRGEMLQFGEQWVCAECKPAFLQRLKEGAALPGALVYGGFWIRFAAKLIDGAVMFVVNLLLYTPFFLIFGFGKQPDPNNMGPFLAVTCLTYLAQFAAAAGYEIFFVGRYAATPGKMACRLKVVMADGRRLSWGRATGRYFATLLSSFTLGIGYIIAAFDEQKRTLHDHICQTRVVRT